MLLLSEDKGGEGKVRTLARGINGGKCCRETHG